LTRIKGTNVHIGASFVLPIEKKEDKINSPEGLQLQDELRLLKSEIKKAEIQKQELIEEGQKKAEELINEAKERIEKENIEIAQKREEDTKAFETQIAEESEKIKAEAYQTGYDDGYKQGYVVITNELENKIHAVDDFAKCQFDLKNNIIKSSELDIITLVVEIAKKVCTKSLDLNHEIVKTLTINAIKELKDKEDITIIVNPKLMEIINSISDRLKDEIPQLKNIKILEDNNVSSDGVIVESMLSRVDSRVKSQINEIADKLFEAYNSEDEEFEKFIMSLEEPDMDALEHVELSDDANIEAFLNELDDIQSYDDKIRDEDAEYYKNLDIEALKQADFDNSQAFENDLPFDENEININDINLDDFEEILTVDKSNNNVENDVEVSDNQFNTNSPITENDIIEDSNNNFDEVQSIENIESEIEDLNNQSNEKSNILETENIKNDLQNTNKQQEQVDNLNPKIFLEENSLLPETEDSQISSVKKEDITGENDV